MPAATLAAALCLALVALRLSSGAAAPAHIAACRPAAHYRLAAVTVVDKPCSTLLYTINNFHFVLGRGVPIFIRHNPGALDGIANTARFRFLVARCRVFTEMLTPPVTDINSYSAYLVSKRFWTFPADFVLTFQSDSALCGASRYRVSDFFRYSYLGAPWYHERHLGLEVGNGGLSLRNQTLMRHIIDTVPYDTRKRPPEDMYFVKAVAKLARGGAPGVVYPTGAQVSSMRPSNLCIFCVCESLDCRIAQRLQLEARQPQPRRRLAAALRGRLQHCRRPTGSSLNLFHVLFKCVLCVVIQRAADCCFGCPSCAPQATSFAMETNDFFDRPPDELPFGLHMFYFTPRLMVSTFVRKLAARCPEVSSPQFNRCCCWYCVCRFVTYLSPHGHYRVENDRLHALARKKGLHHVKSHPLHALAPNLRFQWISLLG